MVRDKTSIGLPVTMSDPMINDIAIKYYGYKNVIMINDIRKS